MISSAKAFIGGTFHGLAKNVRGSEKLFGSAETIGAEIQRRIKEELQLSASISS